MTDITQNDVCNVTYLSKIAERRSIDPKELSVLPATPHSRKMWIKI